MNSQREDSADLSNEDAPRSVSIELYPSSANRGSLQPALDAVNVFFETHKVTDLNNAIELVEQLAVSDERNLEALNGLLYLQRVLSADTKHAGR